MPSTDQLDADKIRPHTERIGRKILVYSSTASTNDIAAEYAKSKGNDGLAVFAEFQTAGRGRAGTEWHSGRGESLLCSIVLTDCKCNPELLSLTCAVAVAETIGKRGRSDAKIKWPNDIILGGKKVAGILLESKTHKRRTVYILGIGINCHQKKKSFPPELRATATSIDISSKTTCDRISLAKALLSSMDYWLKVAAENSEKLLQQWRKRNVQLGHRVRLLFNGREFAGNCIGVDPEKGLILQLDTGGVRMFDAAHTTIAK